MHGVVSRAMKRDQVSASVQESLHHSPGVVFTVASALYTGIALPYAPDLRFIGRLGIVGVQGSGEGARGPAELYPFPGFPSFEDAVEQASHKSVTSPDPVEDIDLPGLDNMPLVPHGNGR